MSFAHDLINIDTADSFMPLCIKYTIRITHFNSRILHTDRKTLFFNANLNASTGRGEFH